MMHCTLMYEVSGHRFSLKSVTVLCSKVHSHEIYSAKHCLHDGHWMVDIDLKFASWEALNAQRGNYFFRK